ncbi:NADH-quinone oxidoreductase subunit 5 family protein [Chromohalobacter israelensis]|uniref:NADH-quinone oxidoreductase subunit 5 family protein n=1 Tax=Chromohalobacter israelensis TaxID=141390 RepID=UPI0015C4DC22|nr:proton-conducting transporter membrane subunit [Chromohalobacter salexigens]NWO56242.1 proton-conducting membrane transporter [Chromohalobacter salexigens]
MLWFVPLLPLLAALVIHGVGKRWPGDDRGRAVLTLAGVAITVATLLLVSIAVTADWGGTYRWSSRIVLSLGMTSTSAVFAIVVPLIAAPIIVYSAYHEASPVSGRETVRPPVGLVALLTAFVGAMELLVLAEDFVTLLIAWELVGACSWALIAHEWQKAGNLRDAAWAFLVTRFGDLGLYIAAAAAFAGTGSFAFADLAQLDGWRLDVFVAGVVLAAAAKSAQVPFSPWLFAAMSGPTPVSALLHAATMVAAGIYLVVRLHAELSAVAWFAPVAITLGLTTALAGGLVAYLQGHAKKLLAASTSAQYGLMWLAAGAGFPGVALVHFVTHAFTKAALFLAAGIAERHVDSYSLTAMRLGRLLPGVAAASMVASLALAGVVPLSAAWSKEKIVTAAGHQASWLAVIVAVAGGLSALYATRFQLLAFGPGRHDRMSEAVSRPGHSRAEAAALYLLAAGTLALSLLWWPGVGNGLADWLSVHFPGTRPWELILSLLLVALGMGLGVWAVRREVTGARRPGATRTGVADWLGLPRLAACGANAVLMFSHGLARFDDRAVDAGIRGSARFGAWLARLGERRGEGAFDGATNQLAKGIDWAGQVARRAHTGQMHHYYTGIAAGLAAILIILSIGALL